MSINPVWKRAAIKVFNHFFADYQNDQAKFALVLFLLKDLSKAGIPQILHRDNNFWMDQDLISHDLIKFREVCATLRVCYALSKLNLPIEDFVIDPDGSMQLDPLKVKALVELKSNMPDKKVYMPIRAMMAKPSGVTGKRLTTLGSNNLPCLEDDSFRESLGLKFEQDVEPGYDTRYFSETLESRVPIVGNLRRHCLVRLESMCRERFISPNQRERVVVLDEGYSASQAPQLLRQLLDTGLLAKLD